MTSAGRLPVTLFTGQWVDLPLEEVARSNLAKLASRKARGVLHGSGDDR